MPTTSNHARSSSFNAKSGRTAARRLFAQALACLLLWQTVIPPALASPARDFRVPTAFSILPGRAEATARQAAAAGAGLVGAFLGFFGAGGATPAEESWGVVLTPVVTGFGGHVGVDHHAPSRKLVLSANAPTGQPHNFELLSADASRAAHSNVAGAEGEILIATARDDDGKGASLGGFKAGELFAGAGATGAIMRVSADGASVRNPWVSLPGEGGQVTGLHVDRVGSFGGDLLAATAGGGLWRVSSSGAASLVANLGTRLAGVAAVPDDVLKYGPWAGKALVGAKEQGGVYAVDAQGGSLFYPFGISPQDIDIVTPHENLFAADTAGETLWGAPAAAFSSIIGDVLVTQESPGTLSRVRWDGGGFVVSQIGEVARLKQVTFSAAGAGEVAGVNQVYDKIAVVRHAPTLDSGRVEGALWQLTGEDVTLDGTDVITSDLLLPGSPSVVTNDSASFKGVIEGFESPQPTGYTVTLGGNASLRHLVTRTNPTELQAVAAPPAPTGTRVLSLSRADESIGDPATLRDLSLSGKAGAVALPPGTYGKLSAGGHTAFVLGAADSTEPTTYNLEELTLGGGSQLRLAGPVVLKVKNAVSLAGSSAGVADAPRRLALHVADGGVSLSGGATLYAVVRAPSGAVTINGRARLRGTASCDRLSVTGGGVLQITESDLPPPPVNRPPAVDAGADEVITLPSDTVRLNPTVSDDGLPQSDSLVVTWSKASGPGPVLFANAQAAATTATFIEPGDYVLRLTASDGQLLSSDTKTVTVIQRNRPPVVVAGQDQTIELPNKATLNADVSDDALPRGSTITVTWSKVSGPGEVAFADPHSTTTTASFGEPGQYVLQLAASDSELSGSDTVNVTVNAAAPLHPPVADFTTTDAAGRAQLAVVAASGSATNLGPERMLDDSTVTAWQSGPGNTNQWVKFRVTDEGARLFDRVRLHAFSGGAPTSVLKNFVVQVSDATDADADFRTVFPNGTLLNNGQTQEFVFPAGPTRARFVRLLALDNYGHSSFISVSLFQLMPVATADSIISLPGRTNAALGESPAQLSNGAEIVRYSSRAVNTLPNNPLDYGANQGEWKTATLAELADEFLVLRLAGGRLYTLDGIKLVSASDGFAVSGVRDFEVWVSTTTADDAAFTKVLDGTTSAANTSDVQQFTFPGGPAEARYVKLVLLNASQPANRSFLGVALFDVIARDAAGLVAASSATPGGLAEAAFDGDDRTVWTSPNGAVLSQWLTARLSGGSRKVYGVRITPDNTLTSKQGPKEFLIRASDTTTDDAAFTTVFEGTLTNGLTAQEFHFAQLVNAKYVQFQWKNGYSTTRISVKELEVLAAPEQGSALLAYSSREGEPSTPENALDIDTNTLPWLTAKDKTVDQYLMLMLPRAESWAVDHVALQPGFVSGRSFPLANMSPKDFAVQVSGTDAADASFRTVFEGTLVNAERLQHFYFQPVAARYVRLVLKNNYGAQQTGLHTFHVFSSEQGGTQARFIDRSADADGRVVSYAWDFGDGTTSSERDPAHAFAAPGSYTVRLTVKDDSGLAGSRERQYRASAPLRADFYASPQGEREGQTIFFRDSLSYLPGPNVQRRWDFGDGTTRDDLNPETSYTFKNSGTYRVRLTVGDTDGIIHTTTRDVVIENVAPEIAIQPGQTVLWGEPWTNAPTVTDPSPADLAGFRLDWDFGDGQSHACASCTNATSGATHAFALPGNYAVRVTVTDKDGGTGSDSTTYTVAKRPVRFALTATQEGGPGEPARLRVLMTDGYDGRALAGKPLIFSLAGRTAPATTDSAGAAEVSIPVAAGTAVEMASVASFEDDLYLSGGGVTTSPIDQSIPRACAGDNRGTDFWLMFPPNMPTNFQSGPQELTLVIASDAATTGTVSAPGLNFSAAFSVQANSVALVTLPAGAQVTALDKAENKGVRVTSAHPVAVFGQNRIRATTDTFTGLPTGVLGTQYLVMSYENTIEPTFDADVLSDFSTQFGVVATADDTAVTITPTEAVGPHPAGVPFTVKLNAGQTYLLRNYEFVPRGDLTGSLVVADKPVAVFGGHQLADVPFGKSAGNYLVEQLPPVANWGKRFAAVPFAARPNRMSYHFVDSLRVLASADDTTVYVNDHRVATLDRGQFHELTFDAPAYVVADKPVLAAQYTSGRTGVNPGNAHLNEDGDPMMIVLPPLDQFGSRYTISTPPATTITPATTFYKNYVNVVVPASAAGTVTLDGAAVPASQFAPLGTSGFVGGAVTLTPGTHNLSAALPFGALVYGYGEFDAYGHAAGVCLRPELGGNLLTLAPPAADAIVGAQGCATATLTDRNRVPLTDRIVNFTVAGANAAAGAATTDASGQAQFCYAGANVGQDTVTAAYGAATATASRRWYPDGPNQPPAVSAGPAQRTTLPHAAELLGTATDDGLPVGSTLAVSWSKVSGPGQVAFTFPHNARTPVTFDAPGTYVLRLAATDSELSATSDVTVVVLPANRAPEVSAGPDRSTPLNIPAQLDGSVTDDGLPENVALDINWAKVSGPGDVTFADARQPATSASFNATGTYVLRLSASDSEFTTHSDVTVTVTPANQPPTVSAGPNQTITLPAKANLSGTATDDGLPAGGVLTVAWSKVSGPGVVTFGGPTSLSTDAAFTAAGTYVLRLTANDSELSATADVTVTVNPAPPNRPPAADAGPDKATAIGANLVANHGNEETLAEGNIVGWTEAAGDSWGQAPAGADGFPAARRGQTYFYAGSAATAELVQDVDLSAFAAGIAAGTQQFALKAYVRSREEAAPDAARVVVEYRDATNTRVIATLDSGPITSTAAWHLTEDVRPAPPGTGWARIRLVAARNTGETNDAYFDEVSLRAVGAAAVRLAGAATDDGLPVGSTLAAAWSKVSGPGEVAFGDASNPSSVVAFGEPGSYVLRLTATDSELTASDDVNVTVAEANLAPTADAGADQTVTLPDAASLAGSFADDGRPAGSGVSLRWSKLSGPGVVTFGDATRGATAATFDAPGTYVLRLTADDGEYDATDDVTVTVKPEPVNQPPSVSAGPNQTIELPADTVTLNGWVIDDGLPRGGALTLRWEVLSGPGTVTFGDATQAVTTATFGAAGTYELRLFASDSLLATVSNVTVFVRPANRAPEVSAGADQTTPLNVPAQLTGSVTDDGLPAGGRLTVSWSKLSGPGVVNFGDASAPVTPATFGEVGTYVLRLTAGDSALSNFDDVTVTVREAAQPPTVEIGSLTEGEEITAPREIVGTVSGGAWRLEYALIEDETAPVQVWRTFASGTTAVAGGVLGVFDPTLLLNGTYAVRLVSTDEYGQSAAASTGVVVSRQMKVGNFTVTFKDLSVEAAGIPVEVTRTYDSRDKRRGDFGVGWTMGLASARVQKNVPVGAHWFETVTPGILPRYCLESTRAQIVTVTFGDGKVYRFRAAPAQTCQQVQPFQTVQMTFVPMPGTRAALAPLNGGSILVAGSVPGPVDFINTEDPTGYYYNPTRFRLTTEDGTSFVINQRTGVESISKPAGETLTITRDGVSHSAGASVAFVRDAEGRIREVRDQLNRSRFYTYSTAGDLETYKDAEGNTTRFLYTGDHLLAAMEVTSADGASVFKPIRNEYDAAGRLLKQFDADGEEIKYEHDVTARREVIRDRLGNPTTYEYDERGNVLYTKDAEGGETWRTYNADDQVLTQRTAEGTTVNTYDADGNLRETTDPYGNVTKYEYNALRRVTSITEPPGRVTTNTYDERTGNLLKTVDPEGNEAIYEYEPLGSNLRSVTVVAKDDPARPRVTKYEYDQFGRVRQETDPLNHVTTYAYDANNNRTSQTVTRTKPDGTAEQLTTSFEYDRENRLVKTTYPDDTFTTVAYNTLGQQSATTDQLRRETRYEYDAQGRLRKTVYPDGKFDEAVYDEEGRPTLSIDRAGRPTNRKFDRAGRLVETLFPDGGKTTTTYDAVGRVLTQSRWLDETTKYTTARRYEAEGKLRVVYVTDALNHVTKQVFDEAGNLWKVTDARNHTTVFAYDRNRQRVKTTHHDNTFETTAYDGFGQVKSKTDQANRTTRFEYDAAGRLSKVIDAAGKETTYGYDEVGNQTSQTDANLHTTRYEYDRLGRRTKRTLPAGMSELCEYDEVGLMKSRRDFNGKTTTYEFDPLNRLVKKTPDASFNQPAVTFTYTATGRRLTMTDATGLTAYEYDARDRLKSKQTPQGTLVYTYDKLGNLKTVRSSNAEGVSVDYAYDELSRLSAVTDNRLAGNKVTAYTYDEVGNLESYTYGNGVKSLYVYNPLNRLTGLTISRAGAALGSYAYVLGPAGNRESVTEADGRHVSYSYDALYRLTAEAVTNDPRGVNGAVAYEYDDVGNRLARNSTLAGVGPRSFAYDANDRLVGDAYDANGNTKQSAGVAYAYDWENRLSSVNDGAVTYAYDGDGNRVAKTVGGVTTRYLVDANNPTGYAQVVEELRGGAVVRQYTYGNDLVSQRQLVSGDWLVSYYGYDGHGSVRALTDAAGAVTDTYTYDAFGMLIASTGATPNEYLYAGERYDAETGMYHLRARYMRPETGRFWTMDSYEGQSDDPASLHKYLYAASDPVNKIDPSGNSFIDQLYATATTLTVLAGALMYRIQPALAWMHMNFFRIQRAAEWVSFSLTALDVTSDIAYRSASVVDRMASTLISADHTYPRGQFPRGHMVGDVAGQNLGRSFPEIDHFEDGVAVSIKSTTAVDTEESLLAYVRKSARRLDEGVERPLSGRDMNGNRVTIQPQDVQGRALLVAIPYEPFRGNAARVMTEVRKMAQQYRTAIRIVPVRGLRGQ